MSTENTAIISPTDLESFRSYSYFKYKTPQERKDFLALKLYPFNWNNAPKRTYSDLATCRKEEIDDIIEREDKAFAKHSYFRGEENFNPDLDNLETLLTIRTKIEDIYLKLSNFRDEKNLSSDTTLSDVKRGRITTRENQKAKLKQEIEQHLSTLEKIGKDYPEFKPNLPNENPDKYYGRDFRKKLNDAENKKELEVKDAKQIWEDFKKVSINSDPQVGRFVLHFFSAGILKAVDALISYIREKIALSKAENNYKKSIKKIDDEIKSNLRDSVYQTMHECKIKESVYKNKAGTFFKSSSIAPRVPYPEGMGRTLGMMEASINP